MNQYKEAGGCVSRAHIREIISGLPETLGHPHPDKRDVFLIRVEQLADTHGDYTQWKAPTWLCAVHASVADHPMCIGHMSLIGACTRIGRHDKNSVSCICT